ncbi:MAG: hypothetical protein MZV49_07415 [Rhodopseudomonas palustris]|nr:hypothetical protein [Rhodopseudomonas palustris]
MRLVISRVIAAVRPVTAGSVDLRRAAARLRRLGRGIGSALTDGLPPLGAAAERRQFAHLLNSEGQPARV